MGSSLPPTQEYFSDYNSDAQLTGEVEFPCDYNSMHAGLSACFIGSGPRTPVLLGGERP